MLSLEEIKSWGNQLPAGADCDLGPFRAAVAEASGIDVGSLHDMGPATIEAKVKEHQEAVTAMSSVATGASVEVSKAV